MNRYYIFKSSLPKREMVDKISELSKDLFGYSIMHKPYLRDMDDWCSYISIKFTDVEGCRGVYEVELSYKPLYTNPLQESKFLRFRELIKNNIVRGGLKNE